MKAPETEAFMRFIFRKSCCLNGAHTHKKRRTHDDRMSRLEIKEVLHRVDNMVCEKCGAPMKVIGTDKAYDELVYIPA